MSNVDVTFIAECQKGSFGTMYWCLDSALDTVLNRTFVPISLVSDKMTILSIVEIFLVADQMTIDHSFGTI